MSEARSRHSGLTIAALIVFSITTLMSCKPTKPYESIEITDPDEPVWHEGMLPSNPSMEQNTPTEQKEIVINWQAPLHWKPVNAGQFQIAKFIIEDKSGITCAISQFMGEAGGLLANINRWRKQLKLKELTEAELASEVSTLTSTGGLTVQWVRLESDSEMNEATLGAIALVHGNSVFVKLSGPKSDVLAEQESFMTFIQSLTENHSHD